MPKLGQERIKLQSTNKIHNFTETQLPEEVTNLLNTGTTFIPTQENFNPLKLSRTISSEINSALELIIKRPAQSSYTSKIKSSRNQKELNHIQRIISLNFFKKNNLNLTLIFTLLITSKIQFHTLSIIYNPQISTNSYNHIILTLHLQPQNTFSNFKTVQTSSLHKLTKTWDGHLCLSHGLQTNTTDTLQTLIHTNL